MVSLAAALAAKLLWISQAALLAAAQMTEVAVVPYLFMILISLCPFFNTGISPFWWVLVRRYVAGKNYFSQGMHYAAGKNCSSQSKRQARVNYLTARIICT